MFVSAFADVVEAVSAVALFSGAKAKTEEDKTKNKLTNTNNFLHIIFLPSHTS